MKELVYKSYIKIKIIKGNMQYMFGKTNIEKIQSSYLQVTKVLLVCQVLNYILIYT